MSPPTLERTQAAASSWSEIPNALRSLWRDCLSAEGGRDIARALVVNFVAIATRDDADALRKATTALQQRTPCRAFLLLLDDGADDERAELAATTRCHKELRDIVLEEISLRLPRTALERMPGLIRPLLVNDLSNHLYWAAPWPAAEREFDALAGLCEHAVVDSRRFGNAARELYVLEKRRDQGQRLTDINWLRLRPWRRALAEAFERFSWQPGTTVRGRIVHGHGAAAQALLLSDWLHERLGAGLAIEPDGSSERSAPQRVELRLDAVEIDVEPDDQQLVVKVTTDATCHLPFAIQASRASDGDLLAAAIDQA